MGKCKKSYKNNKFKISAPTWNEKLELPKASYFASHIQHTFKYIIKKHQIGTDNPAIRIYVNKIEKKIGLHLNLKVHIILNF